MTVPEEWELACVANRTLLFVRWGLSLAGLVAQEANACLAFLPRHPRLVRSSQISFERRTPITSPDDALLTQLLRNGTVVYDWHARLRADEALPKKGPRHGLTSECLNDFLVSCSMQRP